MNDKCETLGDGETSVFLCEPEIFDLLDFETETSKCFERERETFTHRAPNLVESYANELECAYIEAL